MSLNRREVMAGVSAFALLGIVAEAQAGGEANLGVARVFRFDALAVKHGA